MSDVPMNDRPREGEVLFAGRLCGGPEVRLVWTDANGWWVRGDLHARATEREIDLAAALAAEREARGRAEADLRAERERNHLLHRRVQQMERGLAAKVDEARRQGPNLGRALANAAAASALIRAERAEAERDELSSKLAQAHAKVLDAEAAAVRESRRAEVAADENRRAQEYAAKIGHEAQQAEAEVARLRGLVEGAYLEGWWDAVDPVAVESPLESDSQRAVDWEASQTRAALRGEEVKRGE